MAKKTKETTTKSKAATPADPVKTRNLLRLISTLAALLAIAAFLLQLFAVLTHNWKWQSTALRPLLSSGYHYAQPNVYDDSQLYQRYGLYSRNVRVYANNDEQLDAWTSTRFPRADEGEDGLNYCFSRASKLRSIFLTCKKRVNSPEQCHCRRYPYWNWVIFFEIAALVLLGLVVFLIALQSTDLGSKLRPVAAGLAFLAFLFLLVGLLLIVTHLKRETRSFADAYPHINRQVASELGVASNNPNRAQQTAYNYQYNPQRVRRQAVARQASEYYRAYPLATGQYAYNETHFTEYSEALGAWVYKPYAGLAQSAGYVAPVARQGGRRYNGTAVATSGRYGPVLGYDQVYDATTAGIGWSTVLSILATLLSLVLPLLLAFALVTSKKLGPTTRTTTTTVKQEYTAVPLNPPAETSTVRAIATGYDPQRPIGEAVVAAHNVPPTQPGTTTKESYTVHDVVIPGKEPTVTQTTQQTAAPARTETSQTTTTNTNTNTNTSTNA